MKITALNCPNCGSADLKETGRYCEYKCASCGTVNIVSHDFNTLPDNSKIEEKLNALIKNMINSQAVNATAVQSVSAAGADVEKLILDKLLQTGENADPQTLYYIGSFYTSGKGKIDRSARKAAEYYIKSAKGGCADAQYALGLCYFNGEGVEKDENEALKYFKLASGQGIREAIIYAITILEKQVLAANEANKNKKKKEALSDTSIQIQEIYRYLDLWANRDKNSYFDLACKYFFGTRILHSNQLRAFNLFEKSAQLGNVEAEILRGYFYEHGVPLFATYKDVMPDVDKAIKIYESVEHPVAHYLLGCFYLFGFDKKPQDFAKAGKYFLKAAEQNETLSTQVLGETYNRDVILNEEKVINQFVEICKKRKYQKVKLKDKLPASRLVLLALMPKLMKKIQMPNEGRLIEEDWEIDLVNGKLNKPKVCFELFYAKLLKGADMSAKSSVANTVFWWDVNNSLDLVENSTKYFYDYIENGIGFVWSKTKYTGLQQDKLLIKSKAFDYEPYVYFVK